MEPHDYFEVEQMFLGDQNITIDKDMVEKVKQGFDEGKELFVAKNQDYGDSWIKTGDILGLIFKDKPIRLNNREDYIAFGVIVRMLDKYLRYCNLRFTDKQDTVGEKASETIGDLGNYAYMLKALDKGR